MELWGGHECTVNRVGDRFRDQTRLTGHQDRIEDLERFASLGITKLRYPVLWERIAPDRPDQHDWRWTDERLAQIARLGMTPIAGLVHHGSGPTYTSLIDDNFAPLLGEFAAAAAERYPHVEDWTPVNEPLTTARFSALYGFWYPHAKDEGLFWRALLGQVDATRLAMKAIRRVNPAARLVQTEDLGHNYATDALAHVAEYNNHRRWITWDLLTGRVGTDHPLWGDFERLGLGDRVRAITDDPCPPDVVGVNHYVTSERFLDHRLDAYDLPAPADGYHDLTAARVLDPPPAGLTGVMRQAWERYGLPLAVTESHLGCTREEQLRWVWQSWQDCLALAEEGVDVRALTAWALLGNVDWTSLITKDAGDYEAGVFDVRGPTPRPTAIAGLLKTLGTEASPGNALQADPVLGGAGWWQRDIRLEHNPFTWAAPARTMAAQGGANCPLVIVGATGTLGQAFAAACDVRGLAHCLVDRATLPIDDGERVAAFLDEHRPWAVINAAGWVRVDDAEEEEDACRRANALGAATFARACAERGIRSVSFSSDLVFDGAKPGAYVESDAPNPLNAYGRSKAAMEAEVVGLPGALVVRTAAFFSPYDPHNFAMAVERTLRAGERFAASRSVVTPTFVPDLVSACLDLMIDGETGLWHLANGEAVSWVEFARRIAGALDLDPALVVEADAEELGWRARRPEQAALASERGTLLPSLAYAITRYAAVRRAADMDGREEHAARDDAVQDRAARLDPVS